MEEAASAQPSITARPRIAFITTRGFRDQQETHEQLRQFVYEELGFVCLHFDVLSTGRTWDEVHKIISAPLPIEYAASVAKFLRVPTVEPHDIERWRNIFQPPQFIRLPESVQGMIEIAYELVEGRLDAVLHLTDWNQVAGKPPAMVVRRQANVHNVYMASDFTSALYAVRKWRMLIEGGRPVFREKTPIAHSPIDHLNGNVLALIAHDAKKLDMCWFVVEHATQIMAFDNILATGTTGREVKRFLVAALQPRAEVEKKVRLCRSGPLGGDVQIAAAVIRRQCHKVVFLQDPMSRHAHESDIHLFEQAALLFREAAVKVKFELAFNIESARMLLDT